MSVLSQRRNSKPKANGEGCYNQIPLSPLTFLLHQAFLESASTPRRWRACQCFRSFDTAERTIQGIEAANIMRKGQLKRISGEDAAGQANFVESLFGVAA
jgi:hypothetical protein